MQQTTSTPRRAIDVLFDKISLETAQAIRQSGGSIHPFRGRYLYRPHSSRCRWGGPLHQQRLCLPDGRYVVCLPHDESVELTLDGER